MSELFAAWHSGRGPVTVEQLVVARERRRARQGRMLRDWNGPVVELQLVTPGPVKWWSWSEQVFDAAQALLRQGFGERGWAVREWVNVRPPTGAEAQVCVDANPWAIKRMVLALEESHPLGRLWSMDVVTREGQLNRADIGLRPRRCLVCPGEAAICTARDAHPDKVLLGEVERILTRARVPVPA